MECWLFSLYEFCPHVCYTYLHICIYRPQFFFRTADATGDIKLPPTVEMVVPGDNANIEVNLLSPVPMSVGLKFALREGGKTVGAGVVSKVFDDVK